MAKSIVKEYKPYSNLPDDSDELIKLYLAEKKITKKTINKLINNLLYLQDYHKDFKRLNFVIDMIPKGASRPRYNTVLRTVYVPGAKSNWNFFKKLLDTKTIIIDEMIYSAIEMDIKFYLKMPSSMSVDEKILAEKKLIRPISKPDWDNLGKTTDMMNKLVWDDDSQIIDTRVRKYYSFKPRIEVELKYYRGFDSNFNVKTKRKRKLFKK